MGNARTSGARPSATHLVERLFAPVDVASVAFFRVGFGLVLAWHFTADIFNGLLDLHYRAPVLYFTYPGFGWVKPWPGEGMVVHYAALAVLALCVALGLFYRLAAALFAVGFTYVFLLDEARYQNHLYLTVLLALLLIAIPAHRALSLDAVRRPSLAGETVPAWCVWLLRFQIGVVYFFGGVAKINYDWLVRAEPIGSWLREGTEGSLRIPFAHQAWAGYFFSWGGFLLDLLAAPLLLWRRTRLVTFLVLVGFHLTNAQLFQIDYFPWFMIWATLIFFPPDWPRRARLLGRARKGARHPVAPSEARRRPLLVGLGLYVAVQLLVPLRHFLYPGPVAWTEEGQRFSWHMKLRDKRGELRFFSIDPATKTATFLSTDGLLTNIQERMLLHHPDMILQLAHKIAERLAAQGQEDVDIRVRSMVSLNGRPPQPLIDPEVNLAAERRTLGHARWIVPLAGPP